jgi:hypothetical protein
MGGKANAAGQNAANSQIGILQQLLPVFAKYQQQLRAATNPSGMSPSYLAPGTDVASFGGQNLATGVTPQPSLLASYAPTSTPTTGATGAQTIPNPGGPRMRIPAPAG